MCTCTSKSAYIYINDVEVIDENYETNIDINQKVIVDLSLSVFLMIPVTQMLIKLSAVDL